MRRGRVGLGAALACGLMLAGCASALDRLGDGIAEVPGMGVPAGAPQRPQEQPAYPAVHDMPAPRPVHLLTPNEQEKLERDLKAALQRQRSAAGLSPQPARKPVTPPPAERPAPAASGRSIY